MRFNDAASHRFQNEATIFPCLLTRTAPTGIEPVIQQSELENGFEPLFTNTCRLTLDDSNKCCALPLGEEAMCVVAGEIL